MVGEGGVDRKQVTASTHLTTLWRMKIRVRAAHPADAETIHALVTELAIYEREPNAVEASAADYRRQLAADPPPFECLLAEYRGDGPVAFALFFHNYSTWQGRRGLYLEDLFVRPSHRRRGIGRALFRHLAALAGERDCGRLEWKVLQWNTLAVDFYRGLEAESMTEWVPWRLSGRALTRAAGP
jgi:GNAT superfamily N-acetyltransferase